MRRSLALRPLQIVGITMLALIPILGAAGVIGERSQALDMIWRVAFVYFFLMIAFRFAGKRELSEMSPFELVTVLLIPEIFSSALNKSDNSLTNATISVATLFVLVFVTGLLIFRSRRLETLLEGEEAVLVRNGKLLTETLKKERVTPEEVYTEMHKAGVEDIRDVRWAILEVDGHIAIIPRPAGGQAPKRVGG
jgi:uncharacterized membrane protein YcaP (DUF421 family)